MVKNNPISTIPSKNRSNDKYKKLRTEEKSEENPAAIVLLLIELR